MAILLALVLVPAVSAALAGGRLMALADLRFRRGPLLVVSVAAQLLALKAAIPEGVAVSLNLASYAGGAVFLWSNRRVPGMPVLGLGLLANAAAMVANGGIMPARAAALERAGLAADPGGFVNSAVVTDARLAFLGDVLVVPAGWPLANVYSAGDLLIAAGILIAFHRATGSRLARLGDRQWQWVRRVVQRRPAMVPVVGLVPARRIDRSHQRFARRPAGHVLAHPRPQRRHGHLGRVSDMWGDEAVGERPKGVSLREWLGVGDVEPGPSDATPLENIDEVRGDDVAAAGHVDQPGVGRHGLEGPPVDDAGGLGGEGQGQEDHVGTVQRLVQPVRPEHPCPTCQWLGISAQDCGLDPHGGQQGQQRLGDSAPAEDRDTAVVERAPTGPSPAGGRGPYAQVS